MAENKPTKGEISEESNLTVIKIPQDKVDAVIGFISELEGEETEVSGHMISGGALGSFGGVLMAHVKTRTDTGCTQTKTGVGIDFDCSDTDTLTT